VSKAQVATDQANKHLDSITWKTKEAEEKFDPGLILVHEASLTIKLDFLGPPWEK